MVYKGVNHALFVINTGLMNRLIEIHIAVKHHGANLLRKETGIPHTQPGAIRNSVIMQLLIP